MPNDADAVSDLERDRDLALRLARGERRAFVAFFDACFARLYRFVLVRVERRVDLAEDICQQALDKAIRNIGGYRGEAALFTWLCQIARHEIGDHWRRERRNPASLLIEDQPATRELLESLECRRLDRPEVRQAAEEDARLIQVVLDHLPPRYAAALEFKYVDGLSVEQIGQRLDLTTIAAQSLLARARDAFRQAFSALRDGTALDAAAAATASKELQS